MKSNKIFGVLLIVLFLFVPSVVAEDDDIEVFGLELEKLLHFGSGLVAVLLYFVTLAAYKRHKRKRLLYVSVAFLFFAVKGFMMSHELFIEEQSWVDPFASFLNFAILLSFFAGVLKK